MIYKTLKKVSDVCQLLDKSKYPATQTNNGVTFTNNGDGSITVNGTATKNTNLLFGVNIPYPKNHITLIIGTPSDGTGNTYYMGTTFGNDYGNGAIKKHVKNFSSGNCYIVITANTVVSNIIFKPQLFDLTEMYGAGNEPTTVEQFRQDFPEEMYDYKPYCFVKSYKSTMICKTKNLFPTSTVVGTLSGWSQATARQFEEDKWYIGITANNYYEPNTIIEYELTGNYVYINTRGNSYGIGKAFKCEPNQTYTMTCKWVENTNYMRLSIGFYDENGNYLSYDATSDERRTVTTPANCKWFTVCFVGSSSGSSYVYNMQLEEGSTSTDFVPNGYLQSYKKSLVCKTKNLFDINQAINSSGENAFDTFSINNNVITATSDNSTTKIDVIILFYGELPAGDYILSLNAVIENTPKHNRPNEIFIFKNGSFWTLNNSMQTDGSYSPKINFTLSEKATIKIIFYKSVGSSQETVSDTVYKVTLSNIQLELGDTATDYVPYGHL